MSSTTKSSKESTLDSGSKSIVESPVSSFQILKSLEDTPLDDNPLCTEKIGYFKGIFSMPIKVKDIRDVYHVCNPSHRMQTPDYCENLVLKKCLQENKHFIR